MSKKLVHGSTFSGIGAPEIAAEMLGWENAFHCEINPFGRKVLDYYFPNAESYEDITKTDFSKWRDRIDVLTGGFPCQPFSYAGKRKGSEDDRYLWPFMLRCIEQVRPSWFIGENVAGIRTMVLPSEETPMGSNDDLFEPRDLYRKDERFVLHEIIKNLESTGYSVQPFVIPACAVGAPHRRDRVFIVAHRDDAGHTDCLEHPMRSRFMDGRDEKRGCERNIGNTCSRGVERICGEERIELRLPLADIDFGGERGGRSSHDESESGAQRVQERDDVQEPQQSGDVRPEMCSASADTDGEGHGTHGRPSGRDGQTMDGRSAEQPLDGTGRPCGQPIAADSADYGCAESDDHRSKRGIQGEMGEGEGNRAERDIPAQADGSGRTTADTDGCRLEGRSTDTDDRSAWDNGQCAASDFSEVLRNIKGAGGVNASDTSSERLEGADEPRSGEARERLQVRGHSSRCNRQVWKENIGALEPCNRWRTFPTVSAVYRGNDGLPFNVDDLSISFSKWKTESLKAYGNAIVVQVIYEIFRAIDEIENR